MRFPSSNSCRRPQRRLDSREGSKVYRSRIVKSLFVDYFVPRNFERVLVDTNTVASSSDARPGANDEARHEMLEHYRGLVTIRRAEERLASLFAQGEVPGFIHLSIGQEAVSVGVMSALGVADTIASTHRGHGHAIAKGCRSKGSSPSCWPARRRLPRSRRVDACRGHGAWHARRQRHRRRRAPDRAGQRAGASHAGPPAVAVAFFGDGAMAEGLMHESLNLATLWRLPVLFVCENNGWGEFTLDRQADRLQVPRPRGRLRDPARKRGRQRRRAVAAAAATFGQRVRAGAPAALECLTDARARPLSRATRRNTDRRPSSKASRLRDPLVIARRRWSEFGVSDAEISPSPTRSRSTSKTPSPSLKGRRRRFRRCGRRRLHVARSALMAELRYHSRRQSRARRRDGGGSDRHVDRRGCRRGRRVFGASKAACGIGSGRCACAIRRFPRPPSPARRSARR